MEIDITTLSQEAQDYIKSMQNEISTRDKKITDLSKTATQEATEKLKNDTKFMAKLEDEARSKILADANKTAEDKANEILSKAEIKFKEASIKTNKATARELFAQANITQEEYGDFVDMLITDNEEISTANVTKYIEKYNGAIKLREEKIKATYTQAEQKPQQGGNTTPPKEKSYAEMSYTEALEQKNKNKS